MEWKVDETLDRLIREKKVRPTIVVAHLEHAEAAARICAVQGVRAFAAAIYGPRARAVRRRPAVRRLSQIHRRELKPRIDRQFRVKSDRANTAIMGSSMGALISLYAIDEYPQVFGGAGMVSTHWPLFLPADGGKAITDEEYEVVSSAFERYLAPALPNPKTHRLYFDHGSETLDAIYARYQKRIDAIVAKRGYRQGVNWISRNFPGQAHNEKSWASRVEIPLRFLLPPEKSAGRR